MVSGTPRPGAGDLELLRGIYAHRPGAWEAFVRLYKADIYRPCRLAFAGEAADDAFVDVVAQLRAGDFALLRAFDGRASLSAYLRLVTRDLLYPQVARLLAEQSERGWLAFEHFFKRDIERIIARQFPGAADTGRDLDLYHDVVAALVEDGYRRLQGYKGQGSFGGYVLRIVRNLCIDLLRRDMPRRRLPAAIKRLPPLEQEVFRQLYWERCAPEQLAGAVRGEGIAVNGPEAVAAAVATVRAALPRNFKAASEDERPRMVPLTASSDPDAPDADVPDDRATPEEDAIDRQNEAAWAQASAALKTVIARQPPETRLYLQHVMSTDPPPAPREIARLMGRPVTEIYALRQQAERLLRQALRDDPAIKNLQMSV
jgi:RNA polymerase primary sigma factor